MSLLPDRQIRRRSDKQLDRFWMSEEAERTGRKTVGTGLEYRNQIAGNCERQIDLVGQKIERGTERTNDTDRSSRGLIHAIGQRNRVVAPEHLTEIA